MLLFVYSNTGEKGNMFYPAFSECPHIFFDVGQPGISILPGRRRLREQRQLG
ncbi:MAG: hypothetical protein AAFZ15_34670 [Bacteroidota bacterium]